MNKLPEEIKHKIFVIIFEPAFLAEVSKEWNTMSHDMTLRARWLIYHYNKCYALFYAFKKGPQFLNEQLLILYLHWVLYLLDILFNE